MSEADNYVQIIMRDDRDLIVSETPTVFDDDLIVRVYTFEDGAVVNYEWQSSPGERSSRSERFNHKFTLVKVPDPNPTNLKACVIKIIDYPV